MNNGFVVVIEGTDGCGKQTQAQMLAERLAKLTNDNVFETSFPNYQSESSGPVKMYLDGKLGASANQIDAYQASCLYAVDRLCTYLSEIKSHIENGEIVILDRYTPSNALHQAGKIEDFAQRDAFLDWLFRFEYQMLGLPEPNNVVFLDVPPQVSKKLRTERQKSANLKNGKERDIHEQDDFHLKKAYECGKYVSKKYGWDVIDCVGTDGNILPREEINNKIFKQLLQNQVFRQLIKNDAQQQTELNI